ncbi:MAG TPA: adenylate/guanylate cyclase domain-containing protein [Vicinamibacterales bacterium]|nr:adenylate/guanylate cyclase domain-containing protein [Vicinamibacterales bacterium]
MFTLSFTRDGETVRHPLSSGETVMGRAPVCDLTIDDPSISRRHARFRVHGDRCVLSDLGGRNGTFVNGAQVTEAEVSDGDVVVLGRFALRVERRPDEPVTLSDRHSLVESPATLFRPIDAAGATAAGVEPTVDPARLLVLLSEICRRLVRWQPLPEILERVLSVVLETVPAERAFLLLVDDRTGRVEPRLARARGGAPIEQATLSRTVVNRAIQERVAILANDVRLDPRLSQAQSLVGSHVRSFACVPLWNQQTVIGALYVDNPQTSQLSAADLDVLQALSSYAGVAIEQARLTSELLDETRRRERLQRYHSVAVVERILRDGGGADAPFLAEEREVSVVFADIVGFTTRAEHLPPSALAALLNRCFGAMCDAVFAQDGTLDKFIGDAVLAVFGAPLSQPDHAARALAAALAMRDATAALDLAPPIVLRIAINSGRATVGDIGSPRRREYTVLGDVVNTCARLVSDVCQPGSIVLTGATRERLTHPPALRSLGPQQVRGREALLDVFEIVPRQKE